MTVSFMTGCLLHWHEAQWQRSDDKAKVTCVFASQCIYQWVCAGVTVETLDYETALRIKGKPNTCHCGYMNTKKTAWLKECVLVCVCVPGVYRSTSTAWGAVSSSEGLILCFNVSAVVLGTIIGTRDTQTAVKGRQPNFYRWWLDKHAQKTPKQQ